MICALHAFIHHNEADYFVSRANSMEMPDRNDIDFWSNDHLPTLAMDSTRGYATEHMYCMRGSAQTPGI